MLKFALPAQMKLPSECYPSLRAKYYYTCNVLNKPEPSNIMKKWIAVKSNVCQGDEIGGGVGNILAKMRQCGQLLIADEGQFVTITGQVLQPFQVCQVSKTIQG